MTPRRGSVSVTAILLAAVVFVPVMARTAPATWTAVTWSNGFDQPFATSEAQGLALGGKLYSFGGFDFTKACCTPTARAYRMDPSTGWTASAPMPAQNGTGRGGVTHAGMATDGTFIYWAGGYTSDAAGTGQIFGTREVWRYDPVADTYSRMPDLPLIRAAGQLEYLNGGLHYFGGTNSTRTADVGEHWELDLANTAAGWVARAPLPNPRNHLGSTVLGGVIYAVGGQHGHDSALVTQTQVDRYDPATDTWTRVADLPRAIGHIASSVFATDGRLVVLGGETSNGSNTAEASVYDPDTNLWTAITPLPAPRHSGVADVIDGIIYYSTGNSSGTLHGRTRRRRRRGRSASTSSPPARRCPPATPPTLAWVSMRRAASAGCARIRSTARRTSRSTSRRTRAPATCSPTSGWTPSTTCSTPRAPRTRRP